MFKVGDRVRTTIRYKTLRNNSYESVITQISKSGSAIWAIWKETDDHETWLHADDLELVKPKRNLPEWW
jgi:hypothetical protein